MEGKELNSGSTKDVLEKVRECLKARQALQAETHESLEKQKKQGREYNDKLQKVFGVLKKLKGSGLRDPWKQDHHQALTQLFAVANDIEADANNLSPGNKGAKETAGGETGETANSTEQTAAHETANSTEQTTATETANSTEQTAADGAANSTGQTAAGTGTTGNTSAEAGSGLLEQKQTEHGLISRLLDALSWF